MSEIYPRDVKFDLKTSFSLVKKVLTAFFFVLSQIRGSYSLVFPFIYDTCLISFYRS